MMDFVTYFIEITSCLRMIYAKAGLNILASSSTPSRKGIPDYVSKGYDPAARRGMLSI